MRIRRFSAGARGRSRFDPEPSGRLAVAYLERLAERGAGDIDDERLGAALEALLAEHRRRSSEADDLLARGATIFVTFAGRRLDVRLGWLDRWYGERVRGRGLALGFLELADVVRGV